MQLYWRRSQGANIPVRLIVVSVLRHYYLHFRYNHFTCTIVKAICIKNLHKNNRHRIVDTLLSDLNQNN